MVRGVSATFDPGDRVLLLDQKGRTYLISLKTDGQFHFHAGGIPHADLIGAPEGTVVRTPSGAHLTAVRPRLTDFALKMPRGAQVVYPKDMGAILMSADIKPGSRILEAGTGSGALTILLARAVGDRGTVVSYELREEHREKAERNIDDFFGVRPPWIDIRSGDVRDVVAGADAPFDRVILDMPDPWRVLERIGPILAPGAIICGYVPTTIQIQDLALWLGNHGYVQIETLEVLHRNWHVEQRSVRPDHRMVGHTGFLVSGRYIPDDGDPNPSDIY